jgi:uncharacterized repeat protein (TIGR01451 family)
MKNTKMFSRLGAAMVAILLFSSLQQVFATGTYAGTTITNTASAQYNAGTNVRNATSNTVSLTVGYKVVINQDVVTNSSTSLDSTTVYKLFTITNSGNHGDNYKFSVVAGGGQNWTTRIFVDTNLSGGTQNVWDVNDILISNGGTFYVGVDTMKKIIAEITIPGNVADNYLDSIRVTVESDAGPVPGGVTRVGGVGQVEHREKITIAKPVITISGSQTVTASPAIPGGAYQYTVTLQNTGHAPISGTGTLTFKLDNDFSYVTSSNTGGEAAGTVTWTGVALPALMGAPITRTVDVIIENTTNNNTGARVGSSITIMDSSAGNNTPTKITYNDGLHNYTNYASALTPITVAKASGTTTVLTSVSVASRSGNPGDTVVRVIAIKNLGNGSTTNRNVFSFTRSVTSSSAADTFSYRYDTSATQFSGYTRRTDTTNATFSFSLAGGDSMYIAVTDSIFAGLADNEFSTSSYTIARTDGGVAPDVSVGGSVSVTLVGNTTTVTAANISVVMGAPSILSGSLGFGGSTPAPGDSVEYTITITNTGSGTATGVTITNFIPANTTFKTNGYSTLKGIEVSGVAETNAVDGDNSSCDGTTLSSGPYTLVAAGSKIIKYKVIVN